MEISKKDIQKYAYSFESFNKYARGEGLRYLALELGELEDDVNALLGTYFKSLRDNKRSISDVGTLKILHGALSRLKADLDNYHRSSKDLFAKFKRSIVNHDKKKLVEIFGKDYMSFMDDLVPGKGLAEGPKYKAMIDLVGGEDRELMERALACLFQEPEMYGARYQEFVTYFNKIFSGQGESVDNYNWVGKYGDLFKFAALPSFFDVRKLFPGRGQSVEFGEEVLDINLTETEKSLLTNICELWGFYKNRFDKLIPLVDRAYLIDKGYMVLEKQRNEDLHNIFDRMRAMKYMLGSFIADGGTEQEFYDKTGLTFRNSYAKIDNWVYILLKVFPSRISNFISKEFMKKLPRTMTKDDKPTEVQRILFDKPKPQPFTEKEQSFFDSKNVQEYEAGQRSGTQEGESEVIYRERPESSLPVGGLSSFRHASEFEKSIAILRKIAKKR